MLNKVLVEVFNWMSTNYSYTNFNTNVSILNIITAYIMPHRKILE